MKKLIAILSICSMLLGIAPLALATDTAIVTCTATGNVVIDFALTSDGGENFGVFFPWKTGDTPIVPAELQKLKNNSSIALTITAKSSTAVNGATTITPFRDSPGGSEGDYGFGIRTTIGANAEVPLDLVYQTAGTIAPGVESNTSFKFFAPKVLTKLGEYTFSITYLATI
jgi:hypothetical protein